MAVKAGSGRPRPRATRTTLPVGLALGRRADAVHGKVGAVVFLFRRQTQSGDRLDCAIDHQARNHGPGHAHRGADQLRRDVDPTQPAEGDRLLIGTDDLRIKSAERDDLQLVWRLMLAAEP